MDFTRICGSLREENCDHPAVAVEFFKKAYHEARRIRWGLEAQHVDARIAEQAALDKLIEALIVADMHL